MTELKSILLNTIGTNAVNFLLYKIDFSTFFIWFSIKLLLEKKIQNQTAH